MNESPLAVVAKHQKEPPVSPDAIAHELGLNIVYRPLGSKIAGMLKGDDSSPQRFTIFVNSSDHPNRQRFTAAHELAHYILHRDLIADGLVDDTMYRSELSNFYEVQANRLAADILMPIRLVKIWHKRTQNVKELARIFAVSEQAMQIRIDSIARGALSSFGTDT